MNEHFDDPMVETTCPACGYRWKIRRSRASILKEVGIPTICRACKLEDSAGRHAKMASKLRLQADALYARRRLAKRGV